MKYLALALVLALLLVPTGAVAAPRQEGGSCTAAWATAVPPAFGSGQPWRVFIENMVGTYYLFGNEFKTVNPTTGPGGCPDFYFGGLLYYVVGPFSGDIMFQVPNPSFGQHWYIQARGVGESSNTCTVSNVP